MSANLMNSAFWANDAVLSKSAWSILSQRRLKKRRFGDWGTKKREKDMQKRKWVIALAAATGAAGLVSRDASGGILYDPVVTVVGDGVNAASGSAGNTATISVYNNTVPNQPAPVASQAYTGLVNTDSSVEGDLQNNGAVADAAAAGLPYAGTALVFSAGYAGSDGTASVLSTANRQTGQAVVTAASVNTSLGVSQPESNLYVGSTIRSAVGDGSGNYWSAGTGSGTATNGFEYVNTPTQMAPAPLNTRTVQIRNNQLYGSSDTGSTFVGISVVGSGLPTTSGSAQALFNAGGTLTSSSNTASPYSFLLIDDPSKSTPSLAPYNVAYIADLGVNGFGGVQKWTYNPANAAVDNGWSEAYVISDGTNVGNGAGYLGIAGQLMIDPNPSLDQVLLYATNANGTVLEQFADPLEGVSNAAANASVITLATANGSSQIFRGVALAPIAVPEPTTIALVGLGAVGLMARRRKRA
jgi:hypothetical protein